MRRKAHFPLILCLTLALGLITSGGCINNAQKSGVIPRVKQASTTTPTTWQRKALLEQNQVEWITMRGGLALNTKVLYRDNASEKIGQILNMVNAAANEATSTQEEIKGLQSRARPIGILVGFKSGKRAFVRPVYKITTLHNETGRGTSYIPYPDRFIIHYQDDDRFVTAYSTDVANYIRDGWLRDMPTVPDMATNKYNYKVGDSVRISGDGCLTDEVRIMLRATKKNQGYLLAKVPVNFGKWQWQGKVQKEFTTADGKDVKLDAGEYWFEAQLGELSVGGGLVVIK